jgi:hypothetical protein
MMETKIEVPSQVRELVAINIDNIEKALALSFDAATKSIVPNSPESIALLKRVIAVKMDYARKLALASDLSEATAHRSLRIGDHKWKSRQILFV